MKFLAIFLLSCIIFLSFFAGMDNTMQRDNCCWKHAKYCHEQKGNSQKGCEKGICNMMLSCSLCGFVIVQPLSVCPKTTLLNNRRFFTYQAGQLSNYSPVGWHPPKV
jgi:hypothetical protein